MNRLITVVNGLLVFGVFGLVTGAAQQPNAQNPSQQTQAVQNQVTQADQMLDPLNLTPDQIQKIRGINADLRDQRQAANLRLRLAQRSLAEAVESPTPNEQLIEQRSREVADAQEATIRLRSLTEARILQVLTPEQRVKLKEIRQQIRQQNQARQRENQRLSPNALGRRDALQQRNMSAPALGPRQRRLLRQQQQQKR